MLFQLTLFFLFFFFSFQSWPQAHYTHVRGSCTLIHPHIYIDTLRGIFVHELHGTLFQRLFSMSTSSQSWGVYVLGLSEWEWGFFCELNVLNASEHMSNNNINTNNNSNTKSNCLSELLLLFFHEHSFIIITSWREKKEKQKGAKWAKISTNLYQRTSTGGRCGCSGTQAQRQQTPKDCIVFVSTNLIAICFFSVSWPH